MGKFVIAPHFRLQEWVAEDKGYFKAEGLEYEFRDSWGKDDPGKTHAVANKFGAYQSFEKGREEGVSCACHWTVNVAAASGHGKLYADCYLIAPGEIKLSYADGILFSRMQKLIDREVPAAALFSGPYYFAEQLGLRKILDSTFMIAAMISGSPDPEDVRKYWRALRRAQRDIDLRPELHTHHYRREFPARFLEQIDTRRWGPGERLVFETYTRESFDGAQRWIAEHGIFEEGGTGSRRYEESVVSLAAP